MPKRPPHEGALERHREKRYKTHSSTSKVDPWRQLAENSDELIDLLVQLKRDSQVSESFPSQDVRQGLAHLSSRLLPSFEQIASRRSGKQDERPSPREDGVATTPVPSDKALTPWVSSEIRSEKPPIPKVLDPDVERTAFTHPGFSGNVATYERLEWLGDAYIELIATILIYHSFPGLTAGRCSQLRDQAVRNTTLSSFYQSYDFGSKVRLPPDFRGRKDVGRGRSSDKDPLKAQGDVFEAYVAAVIVTDPKNGIQRAQEWLKALWGQSFRREIEAAENGQLLPPPAKVSATTLAVTATSPKEQLAQLIVTKGTRLRYEDMPCTEKSEGLNLPLFKIGVYLDGWGETNKLLATGTALKKKEAGQIAAAKAMEDRKTIDIFVRMKKAWTDERAAEAGSTNDQPRAPPAT